jgi:hypothetical protein
VLTNGCKNSSAIVSTVTLLATTYTVLFYMKALGLALLVIWLACFKGIIPPNFTPNFSPKKSAKS